MSENYENAEVKFLRNALAERFDMSYLELCELDELQSLYDEMEAEGQLEEFLPWELERFKKESLITKTQLMDSIFQTKEAYIQESISDKSIHTPAFYGTLVRLLEEFRYKIMATTLPEPLPDWWSYSYVITSSGICLKLNHYEWNYSVGSFDCWKDEQLTLLETSAKLLTVSEFADLHGIEVVTVRQWIRRGKIRSAVKAGKEWRIPELAELHRDRHYDSCRYNWTEELTDLPEKFAFIRNFGSALFEQNQDSKNQYLITLDPRENSENKYWSEEQRQHNRIAILGGNPHLQLDESGAVIMSRKDREELELYMISNPLIHYGPRRSESSHSYQINEIGSNYCGDIMFATYAN